MPIGFPAYTEKSERFRGVDRKTLVRAALDALDELNWHPKKDGKWTIRASVPIGLYIVFLTLGAKFTVAVEDERLHIRSEGSFPLEWLDVGQHGENIKKFLKRLDDCLDSDGKDKKNEHDGEDDNDDKHDKRRKNDERDRNDEDDTAIKDSRRRKVDNDGGQDQEDDTEDKDARKRKDEKKRKNNKRPKDDEED